MKLVSFYLGSKETAGILIDTQVIEIGKLGPGWPVTMLELLNQWDNYFARLQKIVAGIKNGSGKDLPYHKIADLHLLSPLPRPVSCRDGYAFRQHVETARRNRGADMIAEYDQFPVFYFTNHCSIQGPGPVVCMPDHFNQLDFELEAAIVIGKQGRNISASQAGDYIAGLTIMNDMSARGLQMNEMKLNLGPAKGKDFSTVIGPALVTPDELTSFETACQKGHTGTAWNLQMTAHINGILVSSGNLKDMQWTFAEIIERASYGVTLYPGEIIGSGTVGTGCFLELNGTAKLADPSHPDQWLKENDRIDLAIEQLGVLSNTIVKDPLPYSLPNRNL